MSQISLPPHADTETGLIDLSIVIPCYNETQSVDHLAQTLRTFRAENSERFRIQFVLVDDGSSDDTHTLLCDHFSSLEDALILQHPENRGVAAAIMTGLKAARYELVCSIDSDCTYHPDQIAGLLGDLDADTSMVTASPYHPQGSVRNVPDWRIQLSRVASAMYRCILGTPLYCYTSCFRIYRKSEVAETPLDDGGFTGIAELIWQLERQGKKVVESPAILDVRKFGQSKCRTFSVILRHLRLMTKIAFQKTFARLGRAVP